MYFLCVYVLQRPEDGALLLVMEFAEHGSVKDFVKKHKVLLCSFAAVLCVSLFEFLLLRSH